MVELRQYTLRPGTADVLVDVFERHFVEGQELAGMRIGGLFRDRDDPDRFVWMRGFSDMDRRRAALEAFYTGPVWRAHGGAANATMLDSDNVLLLRPTEPSRPPLPAMPRLPAGTRGPRSAWVWVTAYLHQPGWGTCAWLARDVQPVLQSVLGTRVAMWRSEPAENTFPDLPVRGDHAVVWMASFADQASYLLGRRELDVSTDWLGLHGELRYRVTTTEELHLQPTHRSEHPPPGPGKGVTCVR